MTRKLIAVLFLTSFFVFPSMAEARVEPNPGDYVLRGKIKVLRARPFNPTHKNVQFTRVYASLDTDSAGITKMTLTHAWSGQSCEFSVSQDSAGRLSFPKQEKCRFTALSSKGSLTLNEGTAVERGGRMKIDSTMTIRWLNYSGKIQLTVAGGRSDGPTKKMAMKK